MTLVFIMVGKNDKPIFELELTDKVRPDSSSLFSYLASPILTALTFLLIILKILNYSCY